ncbi:hypothetical protein B9Z19DRAFT_1083738 [Tuber borchii]|uniref:Uncharacterized protein n=1 Tax=Tuber borchii TaxID=42251 RepID=A0A2T6ZT58_TUBBO|nr:hypothetical protein B9Z19DRAFT_1083738 [Tuber borchii]
MASPSLNTTGNPHPLPIPDIEAKNYYYGLYSRPVLVARTSSPEAFLKPKELRPVNEHPLSDVWEESLAFEIHEVLETNEVKIGFMGESAAPIVIWIGGQRVAKECKQLLVMHDISDIELTLMISNPKNHYNFTYPPDRLLKVRGIIPDAEMRKPQMYDGNNKRCLIVLKRGHATGLTLGCATGIKSFLRNYFSDIGPIRGSGRFWLSNNRPLGRIGGLLTGGSGNSGSSDITYATLFLSSLRA